MWKNTDHEIVNLQQVLNSEAVNLNTTSVSWRLNVKQNSRRWNLNNADWSRGSRQFYSSQKIKNMKKWLNKIQYEANDETMLLVAKYERC